MINRAETRSARLSQIEALLIDHHPEGLSQAELACRLDVHRSTILCNLADISAPIYEDHGPVFPTHVGVYLDGSKNNNKW